MRQCTISHFLMSFALLAAIAMPASFAHAQEHEGHERVLHEDLESDGAAPPTHDYSRFSDGPRNVPEPRGAPMHVAAHLRIGTRDAASRLLNHPPDAKVTKAVLARKPKRLLWPVANGRLGRGYGFTRHERRELKHEGVDIGARPGTPVRAAADGIVAYSDNGLRGYGNCIMIVHANGWVTLYAHQKQTIVQAGQRVRRGQRIGYVGSTGIARGPHLHFELRQAGETADPVPLFYGAPDAVMKLQHAAQQRARRHAREEEVLR